jgi:hypothetical protein
MFLARRRRRRKFLFPKSSLRPSTDPISPGSWGRTARYAASAQLNFSGPRPKYIHEAASIPTMFPPKGALAAKSDSISLFEYLSSNLSARSASFSFSP